MGLEVHYNQSIRGEAWGPGRKLASDEIVEVRDRQRLNWAAPGSRTRATTPVSVPCTRPLSPHPSRVRCSRSEGQLWVTGGKAPSEDMYSALRQVANIARSAFHYSVKCSADHAFWFRAIPCSAVAPQRHKIIRNGVALVGEESVSVGHRRQRPPGQSGDPTHAHLYHRQ
jgi:hypothetical protein